MRIFITGGDGMLGSSLIKELLSRGNEICTLIQKGRKVSTLNKLNITKTQGDLLHYESLKKASKGADAIIHTAANTSVWPSRNAMVQKVNVEGTANILRLAKELNVKKLIHVGTANSFGYGINGYPGDETSPYEGFKFKLDYMDSKREAHNLVLNAVNDGLPAIIVNPTFLLGANDYTLNFASFILAVYNKRVIGYPKGGRNYINVNDAVQAIANALDKGRIGESYLLGNENLYYKDMFQKIASVVGVAAPKTAVPNWLLLTYGRYNSLLAQINRKKPVISYQLAKVACDVHFYSAEKAITELDLPQTPIETGIQECYSWLKSNGYLKI